MRPYEDVLAYAPPTRLYRQDNPPGRAGTNPPQPWYENPLTPDRQGRFGEIFPPQNEFIAMMKISDSFDLVMLEESFAQEISSVLSNHPLFTQDDLAILQKTATADQINTLLENRTAIPLEHGGQVVGCVKRAHEHDLNLKADVMFENLAAKASGVLALRHLLWNNELEPALVDYIIETSEEAAGDMNQRGGGNFAKAIGEVAGCINATGSDTRSFCAGPRTRDSQRHCPG